MIAGFVTRPRGARGRPMVHHVHLQKKNALGHAGGCNFFVRAATALILVSFDAGGSALPGGYKFWWVLGSLDDPKLALKSLKKIDVISHVAISSTRGSNPLKIVKNHQQSCDSDISRLNRRIFFFIILFYSPCFSDALTKFLGKSSAALDSFRETFKASRRAPPS